MSQRNDAQSRLWVRTPDSLGKEVDRRLIEAAYGVWERARFVVIRYLAEDTDTAEILETAVDSASCSQNGHASIQQLEAYLLKCVARESIRRSRRNRRLTYIDPRDLERLAGAIAYDWDRDLDNERGMELLRASLDAKGREILEFRVLDYDWAFIASVMGYANSHSAAVQFRKKLDKALERVRIHHTAKLQKPPGWSFNGQA
jgi:hypothetical protein